MLGRAARYDIRWSSDSLTGTNWDTAQGLTSPPVPGAANEWETFTITGLPFGRKHFALKTADEVPNWSVLSNSVSVTVVDLSPPRAVTDLHSVTATGSSITLVWTAPGNDGDVGQAAEYDLRYSESAISILSWEEATPVGSMPPPSPAGTIDTVVVTGLERQKLYHFALRAADESHNWSALSNDASAWAVPQALRQITFTAAGMGAWAPFWSPDGRQIAMSIYAEAKGTSDNWVLQLE
jgi:hypothetical protein